MWMERRIVTLDGESTYGYLILVALISTVLKSCMYLMMVISSVWDSSNGLLILASVGLRGSIESYDPQEADFGNRRDQATC